MAHYSIQELEKISGIKKHTLRIWEQRYQIFNPDRSESNIRTYNDEDVRLVLQIKVLQDLGYKISQIVGLTEEDKTKILSAKTNNQLSIGDSEAIYINQLIEAGMLLNENLFQKAMDEMIDQIGLKNAFHSVLHKVLIRVGMLWEIGDFSPAQEHFTSCLIRDRIIVETAKLSLGSGKTFVLWLPESEEHEIGLLYINYLLRYFGHKVIYLGSRVPFKSLTQTIDSVDPDGVYAFVVSRKNIKDFLHLKNDLSEMYPKIPFYWSGAAAKESKETSAKNQWMIHSIDDFFTHIL
ncbi:MAG: MerR family transcriptional regulator [Crocinitomicaceae bacterium]